MAQRVILISYRTRRETEVSAKTASRVPAEIDRRTRAADRKEAEQDQRRES